MTQEETVEYNKRCAKFLGWKETSEQFKINWVVCKTKERLDKIKKEYIPILEKDGNVMFPDFGVMDFTKDWNWIIEVVEAIKKTTNPLTPSDTTCYTLKMEVLYKLQTLNKEAVMQAINKFLIWYNENKTN